MPPPFYSKTDFYSRNPHFPSNVRFRLELHLNATCFDSVLLYSLSLAGLTMLKLCCRGLLSLSRPLETPLKFENLMHTDVLIDFEIHYHFRRRGFLLHIVYSLQVCRILFFTNEHLPKKSTWRHSRWQGQQDGSSIQIRYRTTR
jgi:hypothetical protein